MIAICVGVGSSQSLWLAPDDHQELKTVLSVCMFVVLVVRKAVDSGGESALGWSLGPWPHTSLVLASVLQVPLLIGMQL